MIKVLFVPDVSDWAIGHLVDAKVKNLPQFNCRVRPVHPRDALQEAESFMQEVNEFNPDIIVYEYFRSCEQLINAQPELKQYKSILVHHNQRDKALFHADWNALGINKIVTHTNKAREKLNEKGFYNVETINHGIDVKFFSYSDKEPKDLAVGYVGRIVPWKGLKEVAQACEELGYPLQIMGKFDKADYWDSIPKSSLKFDFFDCTDNERVDAYHNMTIYVGNSEDNYEEGTLPYLEAMACGVPVVTTPNGVANDIAVDEYNALVTPFGDYEALKLSIQRLMTDADLRKRLRENAWQTVKNMTQEKMAWEYCHLIHSMVSKEELVSVIIPATVDRTDKVVQILEALDKQIYDNKAIEAIVIFDDLATNENFTAFNTAFTYKGNTTHRIMFTGKEGYNLAYARNAGAIQANGRYLLFCDSRLCPTEESIFMFIEAQKHFANKKVWFFGEKGSKKNSFVENFSFISRKEFFKFGMMSEQIDRYGGMSQEIRTRFSLQGGELSYVSTATAVPMMKSGMTQKKREDIVDSKFKLLQMYEGEAH